jgi:hypothetical protein
MLAIALVGCGTQGDRVEPTADDAVLCRELGGALVHIRYETDDGVVARTQLGLDGQGQAVGQLSEEMLRVIELRGWDDEALEELQQPDPGPELMARLADMPSCLDELREHDGEAALGVHQSSSSSSS